jgi:predicted nuclease of restriction endonuclease-like (RecB) superfamily
LKDNDVKIVNDDSITDFVKMIETHRENAYRKVNEELVTMYYEIGKYLSEKVSSEKWGSKVIDNISNGINNKYPTLKGIDYRGLYRMMQFYDTYNDNEIVSPLVSHISWTNNLIIFSHKSTIEEKEFYIRYCIKNNCSKRELERQIASHYNERYILSAGNELESTTALVGEDDYPNTRILDQYSLEFLYLPNNYKEKDLQSAIVDNLKDFILEIGKAFSFIGKEHRVQVGNHDYYIDLLFYNRYLKCLVAFELKVDEFKPEFVSKVNFYLDALDRQEKKANENPSVGIILCTSKYDTVVEYALSRSISPTSVAEYSTKLIDKKLLENKLNEIRGILSNEED